MSTALTTSPCHLLHTPSDLDFRWFLDFHAKRAVPLLEQVNDDRYVRSLRQGGEVASLEVSRRSVTAVCPASKQRLVRLRTLRQAASDLFDLNGPLEPFLELAARDQVLRGLVDRHPGIRLPTYPDPYEGAVRIILGQHVSLGAARAVAARLVAEYGNVVSPGSSRRGFPAPPVLARVGVAKLRGCGITALKARAIVELSRCLTKGLLRFEELRRSPSSAQATLCELPGIGPWSASLICMRVLGHRDAFPASDLGVTKALGQICGSALTSSSVERLAERWRPWRSYATLHLWASLM